MILITCIHPTTLIKNVFTRKPDNSYSCQECHMKTNLQYMFSLLLMNMLIFRNMIPRANYDAIVTLTVELSCFEDNHITIVKKCLMILQE